MSEYSFKQNGNRDDGWIISPDGRTITTLSKKDTSLVVVDLLNSELNTLQANTNADLPTDYKFSVMDLDFWWDESLEVWQVRNNESGDLVVELQCEYEDIKWIEGIVTERNTLQAENEELKKHVKNATDSLKSMAEGDWNRLKDCEAVKDGLLEALENLQVETITPLQAENEALRQRNAELEADTMAATAFEYTDTETGESIPVPFSELIDHAKKLDAKIVEMVTAGLESMRLLQSRNARVKELEAKIVDLEAELEGYKDDYGHVDY